MDAHLYRSRGGAVLWASITIPENERIVWQLISFTGIQSDHIEGLWKSLEPLILKPLIRTGAIDDYSALDILDLIKAGKMQCWAVVSSGVPIAALVTQIIKYPQRQVLDVYLVGGTRMNEWVDKVCGPGLPRLCKLCLPRQALCVSPAIHFLIN